MTTQQIGIVSAPTPATLAYVAQFQRRKAEAKRKQDLVQTERERERAEREREKLAKKWAKPNQPFIRLATVADDLQRKYVEATYVASTGRLPDGKFASRKRARQDRDKLFALGFGGK